MQIGWSTILSCRRIALSWIGRLWPLVSPISPIGSYVMFSRANRRRVGHFRVSTMRPLAPTPDADIVEIGEVLKLRGQFRRDTGANFNSRLSFVTEQGESFLVVNDPAGAKFGSRIEVSAYPVKRSSSNADSSQRHLWVICPHSLLDIEEWCKRRQ